jgi:heavy metal translocating P-type ATPase
VSRRHALIPAAALVAILAGLGLLLRADAATAQRVWMAGLLITGVPVVIRTLRGVFRGTFAADLVAMLAIVTAALLATPLPGLIVVLMQTGGEALERYAEGHASEAVRALEEAAPRLAHRIIGDSEEEVSATAIAAGDVLMVRPGELIPCDGIVVSGRSHLDTAALTGEPIPRLAEPGTALLSGMANLEGPLVFRVTAPAAQSQYARIVELVRHAQQSKAPMQRLADRYAVWFTPLTLAVCAVAWLASGDVQRVLAVLVVATPCPLILAVPVAVIGGINRAARRQVIFRSGVALEELGRTTVAVFDKTGTLTLGRPEVTALWTRAPFTTPDVLRLAGAVEDTSGHLLARSVVSAARALGGDLPKAIDVVEVAGRGIEGTVDGRRVLVGAASLLRERHPTIVAELDALEQNHRDARGAVRAFVAVDSALAGVITYADSLRPGIDRLLSQLRGAGFRRTVLLSGDNQANTEAIAAQLGFDEAHGDLLPEDKVTAVRAIASDGTKVVMLGDGTNDAPALSTATVGVALASGGGGITAEAADVVILADDPRRLLDAIEVSRWTAHIARQSVLAGLGLSAVAMLFAAAGYIPATAGALLQEGIDVAVILNALRAADLRTPPRPPSTT